MQGFTTVRNMLPPRKIWNEVRAILESGGKMYTQLKIDEINNLGAVKIRIRSLLEAMDERSRMENE